MYQTKQRDRVVGFFRDNPHRCFCAKDIIGESSLELGEATAYRLLKKLSEEGVLRRFIPDGAEGASYQYAGDCGGHIHLKCLKCGRLIHADCTKVGEMEEHLKDSHNFTVDRTKTVLYGLCEDCSLFGGKE